MNVEILSRIQFAMTISFHFLFPPMSIGLALILVILQALRWKTGKPIYRELAYFWTRVFGLIFAIGVASGIPMEFQFGTNWARYARFVGDIFGGPLAIEGIYAFFLESGFLALLLFGWNRVGPRTHFFATAMVALGTHFSAIWILVANSWMHTPVGYHLARQVKVLASGEQFPMSTDLGSRAFTIKEVPLPTSYVVRPEDLGHVRAVVEDMSAAILNPSTLDRLAHTILACWIVGAFVVVAVSAWWLLRGQHTESARASLKIGIAVAALSCLLQMVAADATARGVAYNQPTKLAAIEGLAESQSEASMAVAGWIAWKRDEQGRIVDIENSVIRIPRLLSILVSGDFLHPDEAAKTTVRGLADLPSDSFLRLRHPDASPTELAALRPNYWPNVPVIFQTYHLMVALGCGLTALSLLACWFWRTGKLWDTGAPATRALLALLVLSPLLAQVATQAGWFTAEMGRQPWIVYEILLTKEAFSASVSAPQVLTSIVLFLLIYLLLSFLFVSGLLQMVRRGPKSSDVPPVKLDSPVPPSLKSGRHTKL